MDMQHAIQVLSSVSHARVVSCGETELGVWQPAYATKYATRLFFGSCLPKKQEEESAVDHKQADLSGQSGRHVLVYCSLSCDGQHQYGWIALSTRIACFGL